MKKILAFVLIMIAAKATAGVSIGGGSGSSKAATELASVAFSLDHLPEVRVDVETLRRVEARLSVEGVEAVDMPLDGESLTVRRFHSSIVDVDVTRKVLPE